MKIGQTSVVVFLSKFLSSILGFLATLYFARELGAEVIGIYALILTVVGWLILIIELGIGSAIRKRISEGKESGEYLSGAIIWILSLSLALSIIVILFEHIFVGYISDFDQYIGISVVWFIIGILLIKLFYSTVFRVLKGERKVHIAGLLDPVKIGSQSLIQVGLVVAGYSLLGILVGQIVGGIIVGVIGLYWITTKPTVPRKRHFKSLFDYAKFSWLGSLKSRTFNDIDILLLGFFVQSSLIGVYSVAWSIAKFLQLFENAISSTVFPEISYTSAQHDKNATTGLIEESLAFTGLIAIPGLVGGAILSERLMRIYGPEFIEGSEVLVLLVLASLLYSYQRQLMNGLNGIDRPDLAFRVNALFVISNAGLNIVLIQKYGIEGAAIASVFSVIITLWYGNYVLDQILTFKTPYDEIGRQAGAAVLMGAVVLLALKTVEYTEIITYNVVIVIILVLLGATIYFVTLLIISPRFRETVYRNFPTDIYFLYK